MCIGPAILTGCRCNAEAPRSVALEDGGAAVATCRRGTLQLTLSRNEARRVGTEELDPGVELPFAPEPGMGLGLGAQLFATGLQHTPAGSVAVLVQVAPDSEPRLHELAELHGDAAPPRLAVDGAELIIAVSEANASGQELRVTRASSGALGAPLTWRSAPPQARDESNGFDLASRNGRVLVVWDEWRAAEKHGVVLSAAIPLDPGVPAPVRGRAVSGPGIDAEGPRISARPGGYWVAWLVNERQGAEGARVYDPGELSGGPRGGYGDRGIEVLALDDDGATLGSPLRVATGSGGIAGYDLATSPEGNAWLVWRQGVPSPGASGGQIVMAEVRAGGSFDVGPLDILSVGSGEPTWLPAPDRGAPWLTLGDEQDRTLLMRVARAFEPSAPMTLGPDVAGAAAIAENGTRLLFAAPRAGSLEFFAAECDAPVDRSPRPRARAAASTPADAAPGDSRDQQR